MPLANEFDAKKWKRIQGATIFFLSMALTLVGAFSTLLGAEESLPLLHPETVDSIYLGRDSQPVWISDGRLNASAEAFVSILRKADEEGLRSSDYHDEVLTDLMAEAAGPSPLLLKSRHEDLELLLTDAFVAYGLDLNLGRLDPAQVYSRWDQSLNLSATLATLVDLLVSAPAAHEEPGFDPAAALDRVRPASFGYRHLRDALAFYRHLAEEGGWPSVAPGEILRPGDSGHRVALLRTRLTGLAEPDLFDEDLAATVRSFQARHGLQPDGLVGKNTLAALNESAAHKADRIALNLERIRWLPAEPDRPFIRVNIPSCRMDLMDQGHSVLSMKTVVGRPDRPTPVMSDQVRYLELFPYWNVPQKLARRDILPKVLADPQYLRDRDFRVYENWKRGAAELDVDTIDWAGLKSWDIAFRFRQDPGPRNPLGNMKFLFPNSFSIYLHDTNQRDAFNRDVRWLSSGCVRLEDPESLARLLVPPEDLTAALETRKNRTIGLKKKVPILMVYQTVWVDDSGQVNFAPDIYGYDARMRSIMEGVGSETLVSN